MQCTIRYRRSRSTRGQLCEFLTVIRVAGLQSFGSRPQVEKAWNIAPRSRNHDSTRRHDQRKLWVMQLDARVVEPPGTGWICSPNAVTRHLNEPQNRERIASLDGPGAKPACGLQMAVGVCQERVDCASSRAASQSTPVDKSQWRGSRKDEAALLLTLVHKPALKGATWFLNGGSWDDCRYQNNTEGLAGLDRLVVRGTGYDVQRSGSRCLTETYRMSYRRPWK